MNTVRTLLHPELVERIPFAGGVIADKLEQFAGEVVVNPDIVLPGITVAIRTLNEKEELGKLLDDVDRLRYGYKGDLEVVVVDNDSADGTQKLAKDRGAEVVRIARSDFTYPLSMNTAMRVASNNLVYLTVGHALFASGHALQAGVRHFGEPNVAGVFARTLPGENASKTELVIAAGNAFYTKPSHRVAKATMGVMAAQTSFFRKDVWESMGGFDTGYGLGGEDLQYARNVLKDGGVIIEDQLVATHHTHGLGPVNTIRQWLAWAKMQKPSEFDLVSVLSRRPDIDYSNPNDQ